MRRVWQQLDNNQSTDIIAGGIPDQTELYQRRKNGIWRYMGEPCSGASCWQQLDNNLDTVELTATVRVRSNGVRVQALYQRRVDGSIWHYTDKPCRGALCPGWELIDNNTRTNTRTISIVTATDDLYQLRKDGKIWVHTDQPCRPDGSCPGWQLLDTNLRTLQIAAGASSLYKRHDNGAIWRYAGPRCSPDACWQLLYDPTTFTIVSTQN